jgi:hypothetical protein
MTQAKHSPAPWKNGRDANGDVVICQADYATGPEWDREYQANRALFDAAPELLGALQNFINGVETNAITSDHDETFADAVSKARAAIAKATTTEGA